MPPAKQRLIGIAFATAGSVLWSTGGLFSRPITLDLTTTLMWRSLFAALSLMVIVLVRDGRRSLDTVRSLGLAGTAAIPISSVAMLAYVAALKLTTVANYNLRCSCLRLVMLRLCAPASSHETFNAASTPPSCAVQVSVHTYFQNSNQSSFR